MSSPMIQTPLSPLDLDEIRTCIGSFLSPGDISRCIRVSKAWHASFSRLLWYHIILHGVRNHKLPSLDQLQAHASLIRTIEFKGHILNDYFLLNGCSRLVSLTFEHTRFCAPPPSLLDDFIRNHAATLQHIQFRISAPILSGRVIYSGIETCQRLKTLKLIDVTMSNDGLQAFLQACARVNGSGREREDVREDEYEDESQGQSENAQASGIISLSLIDWTLPGLDGTDTQWISRLEPLRSLRHIQMEGVRGMKFDDQLELLKLCPNIRSILWRGIRFKAYFGVEQFRDGIIAGRWPHLNALDVIGNEFDDEGLAGIVGGLRTSLDKLLVKATGFGPQTLEALMMATMATTAMDHQQPQPQLQIQRHQHYLHIRELEIYACPAVTSDMIQRILVNMPSLEYFSGDRLCVADMLGKPSSNFPDNGQIWGCDKRLRVLKLCIDMDIHADPTTPEYRAQQERVYQQLGALHQLETLEVTRFLVNMPPSFKTRKLDHRLSAGLSHLASLRRLKKFLFIAGQELGVAEIEWMTKSWRRLEAISRYLHPNDLTNTSLTNYLTRCGVKVL
ncbi:hypothetical protein BX616_005936 [Lobosporangium transversale]|uniref:F-box domain-containing protein n=1 Tax=Lobosporangium transversale TaxID=64571 RepID=A0A1Y2GSR8_9FUNG|nr:hypothetical protein BCR41DRAFT_385680 [Lobosporangium transversale]KAF9915539.1 hypothetical protein BX616_005936 [Lobosporangium transversale]ORZ20131.1 hypothetical protein BCR41DRAFT_385680 [Lobosporangium transversale]|eukprot:XP_021882671.1 hypothetical protein BCR41DRAFT_385680 [Lobosporangium transversale]